MTNAIEPAAADTIAGRPPVNVMTNNVMAEANNADIGCTPAIIANPITSGKIATDDTNPANKSLRVFPVHSLFLKLSNTLSPPFSFFAIVYDTICF